MRIIIQYLGLVKTFTNKAKDEMTLENDVTLADLLKKLASEFGMQFSEIYDEDSNDVKPLFTVMINGIIIGQLNGVKTKLKDGDNIILMPLMTGG